MKISLKNDFTTFALRLALLYVVLFLCRIVFYLVNSSLLGEFAWSELPSILWGSFVFDSASICYINIPFLLFSLLPLRAREKRWYQQGLFYLYMVLNAFVILLNFADAIYFRYVSKRFTAEEFYFTQNDNNGEVIGKSVAEYWYLVLLFVAMVWGLAWCYKRIAYHKSTYKRYYFVNSTLLVVTIALFVIAIRGGLHGVRPLALNNANLYVKSTNKTGLVLSNPFCVIRTMGTQAFKGEVFYDDATVDSLFTPTHFPDSTAYNLEGRNVVVFTLESFSRENSARLNHDFFQGKRQQGYMPFLDSLMGHSYVFADAFMSGRRRSIDALPATLASLPSPYQSFVLLPQSVAPINGLPKMLADKGYTTTFFNGGEKGSMNFDAFMRQIGVQKTFLREEYEKACGTNDFDGTWGIWDEPFMQFMAKTLDKEKEPFFASIFTLTSHHPFKTPAKYDSMLPPGKRLIQRPTAYTDYSLRQFFAYAKNQPWYANTIFVFVSDHCATENNDPRTDVPPLNTQIVMFIYTPDEAVKGYDTRTAQQADIMPTLLGLLGNKTPYFAFGTDVFNEPRRERGVVSQIFDLSYFTTDSLVCIYDPLEGAVKGIFRRDDPFQKNNLYNQRDSLHNSMEKYLKSYLQSYGKHVEKMDYVL